MNLYPNKLTYFLSFIGLILVQTGWCQLVHEGSPLSWSIEDNVIEMTNIISLEEPDLSSIHAINNGKLQSKNKPFHFAIPLALPSMVNLKSNLGSWKTLVNGDRIWTIIISVPNALGLGLKFDQYHLPKDAKLFIYDEAHDHLLGAYTQQDNNESNELVTLPITGDRIIVEYFEPFEKTGDGVLSIGTVNYQFREFTGINNNECSQDAQCTDKTIINQLRSTVKIIAGDGTKLGTGVLISDLDNNNYPYILTSEKLNQGNPDTWQFIFNNYSTSCSNKRISEDKLTTTGAEIIAIGESTEMMLLKLKENPTNQWSVYYAGWNRKLTEVENTYSLHYSNGGVCQITNSAEATPPIYSENYIKNETWNIGQLAAGCIGAPLYDNNGLVIGIFTKGNVTCTNLGENEIDYFILFSSLWADFKDYLDPSALDVDHSEGKTPPIINLKPEKKDTENTLLVYPNPAKDVINIYNELGDNTISKLEIINVQGQLVKTIETYDKSIYQIDLRGLINGWYMLNIYTTNDIKHHSFLLK